MTKEQKKLHADLREMGCAVSLFVFGHPGTECSIHHIVEGNKKLGEEWVIPLHPRFHQHGTAEYPSLHSVNGKHGGKKAFKAAYGFDEYELLDKCQEYLGREYARRAA